MTALSVFAPRRLARLAASDARSVGRDPMLLLATLLSVLPAAGFWVFRDRIDAAAAAAFGLAGFSRYLVPAVLLLPAVLLGWVAGFLMLEDRDDGPLQALDVTPAGKLGFLAYRLAAAAVLTAAITIAAMPAVVPAAPAALVLFTAALAGAACVAAAVALPALARNKVEGLALTKLVNLAIVVPYAALLPAPFRYAAAIVPSYWLGELLLPLENPPAPGAGRARRRGHPRGGGGPAALAPRPPHRLTHPRNPAVRCSLSVRIVLERESVHTC